MTVTTAQSMDMEEMMEAFIPQEVQMMGSRDEGGVLRVLPKEMMEDKSATPPEVTAASDYSSCGGDSLSDDGDVGAYDDDGLMEKTLEETDLDVMELKVGSRVRFSTVQVREYSVILGDSPMADEFPISLDWSYVTNEHVSIDDYDSRPNKKSGSHHQAADLGRGIQMPMMTVSERVERIATVSGIKSEDLQVEEKQRQLQVQKDKRRAKMGLPPTLFL